LRALHTCSQVAVAVAVVVAAALAWARAWAMAAAPAWARLPATGLPGWAREWMRGWERDLASLKESGAGWRAHLRPDPVRKAMVN
jgi:hypothetical protein